mgnify:CR=1 FL=1
MIFAVVLYLGRKPYGLTGQQEYSDTVDSGASGISIMRTYLFLPYCCVMFLSTDSSLLSTGAGAFLDKAAE